MSEAHEQRKWERAEVVILVTEYFRTKNYSSQELVDVHNKIGVFGERVKKQ